MESDKNLDFGDDPQVRNLGDRRYTAVRQSRNRRSADWQSISI